MRNHRGAFVLFCCLLLAATSHSQTRLPGGPGIDLNVHVVLSSGHPAGDNIRVQLLSTSGGTMLETTTSGPGQARFQVGPGNYRLRLSGVNIETTETGTISVMQGDVSKMEMVTVKPLAENAGQGAAGGMISAAQLGVPDDAQREFEKGAKAMEKSDDPTARHHFEKAVQIYPKYAMAYNNLGVLLMRSGDRDAGLAAFDRAVEIGGIPGAYVNRARIAAGEAKHLEAVTLLHKALTLQPNHAEALLLMANSRFMLGDHDATLEHARMLHQVPHEAFAAGHLLAARVLEERAAFAEAIEEYKLFLIEAPLSPTARRVNKAIRTLEQRLASKNSGH